MKLFEPKVLERLFDPRGATESPLTIGILACIFGAMVLAKIIVMLGARRGRLAEATQAELNARLSSWVILIAAIATPIILGAAFAILGVMILSLLCYREYSKTVGTWQIKSTRMIAIGCICMLAFASLDHFDRLYFAMSAFGVGLLVVGCVVQDTPKGFIQRVALSVFGFVLFGYSIGYLGLMANSAEFRPLLLCTILAVEANDVIAYCCGKTFRGPKLIPSTSPGKTISGALGALVLTSILVAVLFHNMFGGTAMDRWWLLLGLGVLVSALGQLGDLTLSAIKRDIGVKDFGTILPGHGGYLDRFDSLVLVPPVVYHFLSLFLGPLGQDQPTRIVSGWF